jgi:type VI secretion system (T6SS) effector Hcp
MTSASLRLSRVSAAIALCFALTAAPAVAGGFLRLGGAGPAAAQGGHGGEIEIESFSWGSTQTQQGPAFVKSWSSSGDADDGPVEAPPGAGADANESVTVGGPRTEGRRSASGLATGKRQHKPMTIIKEMDMSSPGLAKPLPKGSVWIRVSSPWAGCRVGDRYPEVEFGTPGKVYTLSDVVITSCGRAPFDAGANKVVMETVELSYERLR